MKHFALGAAALLFTSSIGVAQTTIIEHDRSAPPPVVIDRAPTDTIVKDRSVDDDHVGCRSATTTKTDETGMSRTKTRTEC